MNMSLEYFEDDTNKIDLADLFAKYPLKKGDSLTISTYPPYVSELSGGYYKNVTQHVTLSTVIDPNNNHVLIKLHQPLSDRFVLNFEDSKWDGRPLSIDSYERGKVKSVYIES